MSKQITRGGFTLKKLSILLVFVLMFSLVGCSEPEDKVESKNSSSSSNVETDSDDSKADSDEKVVLTFATWGVSEDSTTGIFKVMEDAYEAANPNVDIEYVGLPFGDIKQQTFVMAASGDAPDIIQTHTAWFSTYASSDVVAPLDDLLGSDYVNDLIPSLKADYTFDGKLMGIPWAPTPYVLYWNKELFEQAGLDPEQPPKTYDEMLAYAEKIAELTTDNGDKIYGLGEPTDKVPINGMVALRNIYGFGGNIMEDGKVVLDSPEVVEAFEYYKHLATKELTPTSSKLKDLRNLFAIGRLGMYMDESGAKNVFRNLSGQGEAFDAKWGVSLVPVNAGSESISVGAAHGLVISSGSDNKEIAADFLRFITDKEMIQAYHDAGDVLSARVSISSLPEMNNDDVAVVCNDQLNNYSMPLPENNPGMEQAYLEIADALQQITLTDATAQEVVAGLSEKLKGLLE